MFIPQPRAQLQTTGVVSRWHFYVRQRSQIYLQVWRKSTGSNRYQLVGQSSYRPTRTGVITVYPREKIQVLKGDVLGFYFPSSSVIPFDGRECTDQRGLYVKSPRSTSVRPGANFSFRTMQSGWKPCRQYSLHVTVRTYGRNFKTYFRLYVYQCTTIAQVTQL